MKKGNKILKNRSFQDGLFFLIISIALLIYSFYKHYTGLKIEWKMSPYLFPIIVASFLFLLSLSLLIKAAGELKHDSTENSTAEYFNLKNFLITLVLVIAYYFALKIVPFFVATILLLALLLILFNERRWWVILLVSVLTTGVIYLIFSVGLHVNLP